MPAADILAKLHHRRALRQQLAQQQKWAMAQSCPQASLLQVEIDALLSKAAKSADPKAFDAVMPQITALRQQQSMCLSNSDKAMIDLPPSCPYCQDNGYVDGGLCTCVKQALLQEKLKTAGLVPSHTFDQADFSLFSEKLDEKGISTRAQMQKLYTLSQQFADTFPDGDRCGMLLMGDVGTGKTFLMDCIGARVMDRGFTVARVGAHALVRALRIGAEDEAQSLHSCDLLLVDDLGTEPMWNNATIEALQAVIGERLSRLQGLIITTNLSLRELSDRYGERLLSRLTDKRNMLCFALKGADLRVGA